MAWECGENARRARLPLCGFGGLTPPTEFPGCSKARRASWTDWCALEPDTPTLFLALPAARPLSGPHHAPKFTPPGGCTSTVVPMGPDEDIGFQEGDHLTRSAPKRAVLPAALSYATFGGRFDSLYGSSLDVVTPSSRTIRSLVRHRK